MRSTYFGLQDVKAHKVRSRQIAKGYTWNNNTKKHDQVAYMPLTDLSGAAAVISNARDYAKWIQGLLGETNLFSQDVHGDIRKGRMIHFPSASGGFDVSLYSLGWFRRTYNGRVYYWHDGSMIGFKCLVYWFPNDKFGFVIFANGDDAEPSNNNIAWKIIADRFQIPEKDVGVGHWHVTANPPRVRTTEEQRVKDAVNLYYPNRSQDPPDLALDDIVGVYSNKGYGRMRVAAEIKKKSQGPIRTGNLVVERPEMTWHYGLRLKHVFGPNWIACESWIEDLDNPGQFHPAMFIKDARGKASALKIGWWANGAFEGNVTFTKIA
ncbi:hypothetical protein QQS21_002038 [Conoideocrella luteorostrata]|uniref:Beta-lactamase-related domain-containing protein n=1 Tax=Conoideocrella luteorostrata TaxID=1105319 RepID=A0AAJ0CZV6_9HYPO|nr:hypothetical protein QQS21_002038 [Conoideocrella luteorostrata]